MLRWCDTCSSSSSWFALAAWCALAVACGTAPIVPAGDDDVLPAELVTAVGAQARSDAVLSRAAKYLCARGTDAIIDDDVREHTGLFDGTVLAVMSQGEDAWPDVVARAPAAQAAIGANRAGLVRVNGDAPCAAVVLSLRLLEPEPTLPSVVEATVPLHLRVSLVDKAAIATVYLAKPDGFVWRAPYVATGVPLPLAAEGSYTVEVMTEVPGQSPRVALLWPLVRGRAKTPPAPAVLFGDDGHDDRALSHRAEALVQRLRNEQLIEPVKVSPLLINVAAHRAQQLAQAGTLDHLVGGETVVAAVARAETTAGASVGHFVRLSEVQASATTLEEAWQALLASPAHRYELVEPSATHGGVAVVRGTDGQGAATVHVVAVFGKKPPQRTTAQVRAIALARINAARTPRGLDAVRVSPTLDALAQRLSVRMQETQTVSASALGAPVGELAIEQDATLAHVEVLVVKVNDPLVVFEQPPAAFEDIDMRQVGVGFSLDVETGVFYVCVLAAD